MYSSINNILTAVQNKDIELASVYDNPNKLGDGEHRNDKSRTAWKEKKQNYNMYNNKTQTPSSELVQCFRYYLCKFIST